MHVLAPEVVFVLRKTRRLIGHLASYLSAWRCTVEKPTVR